MKWEYLCVKMHSPEGWIDELNRLGAQGWELVQLNMPGTIGFVAFFKRPLP
jgi:hypothetical protein